MMAFASRATADMHVLAVAFSSHTQMTLEALSGRMKGVQSFFIKLPFGADCMTGTAQNVVAWFDAYWPADLAWPDTVVRPFSPSKALLPIKVPDAMTTSDAAFLASLTVSSIWTNGRRPPWWGDLEIRELLTRSHRQMTLHEVAEIGRSRFGDRCPSISAIHRFWEKLDQIVSSAPFTPRPPKTKKEAA